MIDMINAAYLCMAVIAPALLISILLLNILSGMCPFGLSSASPEIACSRLASISFGIPSFLFSVCSIVLALSYPILLRRNLVVGIATHFTPSCKAIAATFVRMEKFRRSRVPLLAFRTLRTAFQGDSILRYNIIHESLHLSSRLRYVTSMRGGTTLLPLDYTINPPVKQVYKHFV